MENVQDWDGFRGGSGGGLSLLPSLPLFSPLLPSLSLSLSLFCGSLLVTLSFSFFQLFSPPSFPLSPPPRFLSCARSLSDFRISKTTADICPNKVKSQPLKRCTPFCVRFSAMGRGMSSEDHSSSSVMSSLVFWD